MESPEGFHGSSGGVLERPLFVFLVCVGVIYERSLAGLSNHIPPSKHIEVITFFRSQR